MSKDRDSTIATLKSENLTLKEQLMRVSEDLKERVLLFELLNWENQLLNEMSSLFQSSQVEEDIYKVLSKYVRQLFKDNSGAFFKLTEQKVVEVDSHWGEDRVEKIFDINDCWALRRGESHEMVESSDELLCPHLKNESFQYAVCVPVMTSEGPIGLMTLCCPYTKGDATGEAKRHYEKSKALIESISDRIGTALSNVRLRQRLHEESIRDPLTKLFNRRFMTEALDWEIRKSNRNQAPLSVIMADIDHFKHFNDTYGHDAGDFVLREISKTMKLHVREEDVVCRYGGEEFILILASADTRMAIKRAETIRKKIRNLKLKHKEEALGTITMSFGVATYPNHALEIDALITRADEALYSAKEGGRDRVEQASEDN